MLNHWFKQQERRNRRFVSLYDCLLLNRKKAYVFFRLNFFGLQTAFRYFIHLAIFFVLYTKLHDRHLNTLVIFWSVVSLASAAWWGILEILRTKVRYAHQAGKTEDIDMIIGNWLLFSAIIAAGFLTFAASFLLLNKIFIASPYHTSFDISLYIAIICIINAGEIMVQTFRAGVYAVTRIIRPAFSLIIGPLIATIILLSLWSFIHFYALLVALIIERLINLLLIFTYTKRMYHIVNFSPTAQLRSFYAEIKNLPFRDAFLSGAAAVFMHLDGLLILAAYITMHYQGLPYHYLFATFILAPLVRAGFSWAQLFYFDLKKLERVNFKNLTQHFDCQIDQTALIVGLGFWLISSLIMLIAGITLWKFYLLSLPLFCLRSQIAYRQIRAFSTFHYLDVICSGILLLLGYAVFILLPLAWTIKLVLLLLVIAGINFCIKRFRFAAYHQIQAYPELVDFYEWLTTVKNIREKMQLLRLDFSGDITYHNMISFLEKLGTRNKNTCINACRITQHRFLLCGRTELTDADIVSAALGLVKKIKKVTLTQNNATSITAMLNSLIKDLIPTIAGTLNNAAIIQAFLEKFPAGVYFDPVVHGCSKNLNQQVIHNLLFYVKCYLNHNNQKLSRLNYYVAVLFKHSIEIIFLIPKKKYSKKNVSNWLNELRQLNIQNCLAGDSIEAE